MLSSLFGFNPNKGTTKLKIYNYTFNVKDILFIPACAKQRKTQKIFKAIIINYGICS